MQNFFPIKSKKEGIEEEFHVFLESRVLFSVPSSHHRN
jgi:hypothetical protein